MQLTVSQAAAILGTHEQRIYRRIDDGRIPFYRVNDHFRFNLAELIEWAIVERLPLSARLFQDEDLDLALPSLTEALALGGIHYHVLGSERETVLRAVAEAMPIPNERDRELLVQLLLARESMGSTSIGDGIAIPHVRNPVVLSGAPASVTLCFLEQPIEYSALDGLPVHTLFSIVSATIRGHLRMLAQLSRALLDPGFRAVVLRRGTAEEIQREAARLEAAAAGPSAH